MRKAFGMSAESAAHPEEIEPRRRIRNSLWEERQDQHLAQLSEDVNASSVHDLCHAIFRPKK